MSAQQYWPFVISFTLPALIMWLRCLFMVALERPLVLWISVLVMAFVASINVFLSFS